jgi:hypothetical protein
MNKTMAVESEVILPVSPARPPSYDEDDDEYDRFLHCSHCHKHLSDPITLPCFHSYCKRCIEEIAVLQRQEREANQTDNSSLESSLESLCPPLDQFKCPKGCEGDTGISIDDEGAISGLPPSNNFLKNLIHTNQLKDNLIRNEIICQNCDEGSIAVAICNNHDCANKPLCADCLTAHLRTSKTKEHLIIDPHRLDSKEQWKNFKFDRHGWYCDKHPEYVVNRYCYDHDEVICRDCSDIQSGHRSCPNVELVDACIANERSLMEGKLELVKGLHEELTVTLDNIETMKRSLKWNVDHVLKITENHYQRLVDELTEQYNTLVSMTNAIYKLKLAELEKHEAKLRKVSETFTLSIEFISYTLATAIPVEYMFLKVSFMERIDHLLRHYKNYHKFPTTIDNSIHLNLNESLSLRDSLGSVYSSPFIPSFTICDFPQELRAHHQYTFSVKSRDIHNSYIRGNLPELRATVINCNEQDLDEINLDPSNDQNLECYVDCNNSDWSYTVFLFPRIPGRHKIYVFCYQDPPLQPIFIRDCPLYFDIL